MPKAIPVSVQMRHVHLSEPDTRTLFGDSPLTVLSELTHRGQMVYNETVSIIGKGGRLDAVRILGPARAETQLELSVSEAAALGLKAPLRLSGDASYAGWCTIVGPVGELRVQGAIIPARHLHLSAADAKALGVLHLDVVSLAPEGRTELRIEAVTARVHPTFATEFHLSSDEAASFWLQSGDFVQII